MILLGPMTPILERIRVQSRSISVATIVASFSFAHPLTLKVGASPLVIKTGNQKIRDVLFGAHCNSRKQRRVRRRRDRGEGLG